MALDAIKCGRSYDKNKKCISKISTIVAEHDFGLAINILLFIITFALYTGI